MSDLADLPPRRLLGAPRRLRALAVLMLYCLAAILVVWATHLVGRDRVLDSLYLVPALLALAAGILLAPPSGTSPTPRQWAHCLAAAALVGTVGSLLGAFNDERWRWLGEELFYAEWQFALGRLSIPTLICSLALYALAPLPLLLVRQHTSELEWQAAAAAVCGLPALTTFGAGQIFGGQIGHLAGIAAFVVLGAGSYWIDRWVDRGRPPGRPPAFRGALLLALASVLALGLGGAVRGVALLSVRGVGGVKTSIEVEQALLDCSVALDAYYAKHKVYPACLGELPGVDPDLAAGLKAGYVIRYGQGQRTWSMAADPLPELGERRAFYLLRDDRSLDSRDRPYGLTPR